jgi:hypothetical protein
MKKKKKKKQQDAPEIDEDGECSTFGDVYEDAEELFGDAYTEGSEDCFNFAASISPFFGIVFFAVFALFL